MGILDGQPVSAAITNPAFINKNQPDIMPNILGFTGSGAAISDIQAAVNRLYTCTGASETQTGTIYNATANTITNGDSHLTALTKLADKFDAATGHTHTGAAGDAPPITGGFIVGVPYQQFEVAAGTLSAVTGSSVNVTSVMTGKPISTSSTTLGVITNTPYNRTFLANGSSSSLTDCFIDSTGNIVYGRLTETTGTWTLSFYSLIGGVETAYSFSNSTNITWYYRELFQPLVSTPVYTPDYNEFEFKSVHTVAATGNSPLFGDVIFQAASGTVLTQSGQDIIYSLSFSGAPQSVGSTNIAGTSLQVLHSDHVHQGVHSIAASGSTALFGDIVIAASAGVSVNQSGQNIILTGSLSNASPLDVGSSANSGISTLASRDDHIHRGVHSIAATGSTAIYGDVIFQAASGTIVSQAGQDILYSADEFTGTPSAIAAAGSSGTSLQVSKGDHTHAGVHSIAASGFTPSLGDVILEAGTGMTIAATGSTIQLSSSPGTTIAASGFSPLSGAVVLVAGTNMSITEAGQNITIAATGGGLSPWATSTSYSTGNVVTYEKDAYICIVANTSAATFETDVAANKWILLNTPQVAENLQLVGNNFEDNDVGGWTGTGCASVVNGLPTSVGTGGAAFSSTNGGRALGANTSSPSVTSTNPINGIYSLNLATTGAGTIGDGYISQVYFIPNKYQAQVLSFKLSYKVVTGTPNLSGTSSNTYAIAIYDVANNAWFSVAGNFNFVQSTGVGTCTGTFQTATNSTGFQVFIYSPVAPTGASSLYLDDFFVGPQTAPMGPAMSDWQTYTVNITGTTSNPTTGTVTTNVGYYRRVGDSLEVQYSFVQSAGGTAGSGTYLFSLPSGLSIDTTKVFATTSTTAAATVGAAQIFNSTTTYSGDVIAWSASSLAIAANNTVVGSAFGTLSAAAQYSFHAMIPIVGWSSNTNMSNDTDTRVVAMRAVSPNGAGMGTLSTSNTTVVFNPVNSDTHGAYNASTGVYTVPVTGYYNFSGFVSVSGTGSAGAGINLGLYNVTTASSINFLNGFAYQATTGINVTIPFAADSVYLTAGTQVLVQSLYFGTITTPAYAGGLLSISRRSGPAVIAATESVNATYTTSTTTIGTTATTVLYTSKLFDTHNAYNTGTGLYTVPVSGKYRITGSIIGGAVSSSTTNQGVQVLLQKNGTTVLGNYTFVYQVAATAFNPIGNISGTISCNAGDTLSVAAMRDLNVTSFSLTSASNYISIERIGN